jgi:hypothetical protein
MTRKEADTTAAREIAKKMDFRPALKMLKMQTGKQVCAYYKAGNVKRRTPSTEGCRRTA